MFAFGISPAYIQQFGWTCVHSLDGENARTLGYPTLGGHDVISSVGLCPFRCAQWRSSISSVLLMPFPSGSREVLELLGAIDSEERYDSGGHAIGLPIGVAGGLIDMSCFPRYLGWLVENSYLRLKPPTRLLLEFK